MGKAIPREPDPNKPFLGGSGILIPFNPNRMRSSKLPSTPPGSEAEDPMLPMARKLEEQLLLMVSQDTERLGITPSEPSESTSAKPKDKN